MTMALLDDVRKNKPSTTKVSIYLNDADARELMTAITEALHENSFVKGIDADFRLLTREVDIDHLLHIIEHRDKLEEVGWYRTDRLLGKCDSLLQSVSRNGCIHTLTLCRVRFSTEALSFIVRSTMTLQKLHIECCEFESTNTTGKLLTSAFQINDSIRDLLLVRIEEQVSVAILTGLGMSDLYTLENLTVAIREPSVAIGQALRGLLFSPKVLALPKLRLDACRFSGATFAPISQGISRSINASTICFDNCKFDLEATCLFEHAFQTTSIRQLDSLVISVDYTRFSKSMGNVLTSILGHLSFLRKLSLRTNLEVADINVLMQAVARSPNLECLLMHHVDSEENCQALATGLAKVYRLKQFHFGLSASLFGNLAVKRRFMRSFRQNASIEEVTYVGYGRVYWDDTELSTLARYLARNKTLSVLVDRPGSIPVEVWPSILKSVCGCECGSGVVARILVKLGERVGKTR